MAANTESIRQCSRLVDDWRIEDNALVGALCHLAATLAQAAGSYDTTDASNSQDLEAFGTLRL